MIDSRQVHALVDQLGPAQMAALQQLLEAMLDPVARAVALAPVADEPLTTEEAAALDRAEEWLRHNNPIPHEDVLAEFGFTAGDFPLESNGS